MREFCPTDRVVLLCLLILGVFPSHGQAQERKWELEGHAGWSFVGGLSQGVTALPPVGGAFTTVNGLSSRGVSSWFFGDGALLLNQVLLQFADVHPRITLYNPRPLDPVLHGPLIEPSDGGMFGFRVGRRISSRLIAELTFDRLPEARQPEDAFEQFGFAVNTFDYQWSVLAHETLITAFPQKRPEFVLPTASQRRLVLTGAANVEFATSQRLRPYVAAGAGILNQSGSSPTASVQGWVQYQVFPNPVVEESDDVQLTAATQKIKPVGVAGGGVRIPISDRIGLRADARIYFSGNRDETFVSAVPPNRTSGVSSGYFEIGTAPAIQLQSNPQSPNSQVSFSGPTLSNFRTFQGTGLQTDLVLSVGAFWRF